MYKYELTCGGKCILLLGFLLLTAGEARAQAAAQTAPPTATQTAPTTAPQPLPESRLEVYGYVMTDFGFDFNTINPDWFDTERPTKLPSFEDEFGRDGRTFAGVRQTRFGVKGFDRLVLESSRRPSSGNCSARVLTPGRLRFGCATPTEN